MYDALTNQFLSLGLSSQLGHYFSFITVLLAISVLSVFANFIAKKIIVGTINSLLTKAQRAYTSALLEYQVFHRLSHIAPILVIYFGIDVLPNDGTQNWSEFIAFSKKISMVYITIVTALVIDACLNAGLKIYLSFPIAKEISIRSYLQVVKIFIVIVTAISVISILLDKNPSIFIGGLGAMTAVIMLVFKDPILGLVASFQLSANRIIRLGDWIEAPKYGIDGDVIDISLTTVRIQNFDKTVVSLPTYVLVSDAFKNWRGMSESGGRRIKRSIAIDMNSVQFCTGELLEQLRKIDFLRDYIDTKLVELTDYNQQQVVNSETLINGRNLTNLGLFRAYLANYLRQHAKIHQNMTCMVRQLQPTADGIPLEIYSFTNDTRWESYETIQADIFDHILAIIPEFKLRVFQNMGGYDIQKLKHG